jgi:hypothetical protein
MIGAPVRKPAAKRQQESVLKQIIHSRAQLDDLNYYLDLLEARARSRGKLTFSTDQVRKRLGLA